MRSLGTHRLPQIFHRIRPGYGGIILMYHRVAEVSSDPWAMCVSPRHFAEHLEVLRKHGSPMPLQQLTQCLVEGSLPRRAMAVTFDDGYADNLHNAKPLLERYDVPATVFMTTGCIGRQREFWWDELERLLLQPGMLPEGLHLSINGGPYSWRLGKAAHLSEDNSQHHRHWRAWEKPPTSRHALYYSSWKILQHLSEAEQQHVLKALREWAGVEPSCRPTYTTLTPQEVVALTQGGLIEVGSHTVTHPQLSALPLAWQRDEIQQSKAQLEEILDGPVTSFAYPYGNRGDYTAETVTFVRGAQFDSACSNFAGVVGPNTDRFQLPRIHVKNWDGEEFARRLSRGFQ